MDAKAAAALEAAQWVQNYLRAIEASGQHAPTTTMQQVVTYLQSLHAS